MTESKMKRDVVKLMMTNKLLKEEIKRLQEDLKKYKDALLTIEYETPALGGKKKDMREALLRIDNICREMLEKDNDRQI